LSFNINVVCPKCEEQHVHSFIGPNKQKASCKKCITDFYFLYATTRAKKSRGDRKSNTRELDIRVFLVDGSESYIQFSKSGWDDIELRAKDGVVFSFLDGNVRVVQNIKIGSYTKISVPSCYIATYVFGPYSAEVSFLRKWRDNTLNSSILGRMLVESYYHISPILLRFLGSNKLFSKSCKVFLNRILKSLGYKGM
jgi:hypothetical protein